LNRFPKFWFFNFKPIFSCGQLAHNGQRYAASRFGSYNFVCGQNALKQHKCFCLKLSAACSMSVCYAQVLIFLDFGFP
jgi:hypothetical protein